MGAGLLLPARFTNGVLDNFNRADANPLDGSWTQGFQGTFDGNLQVTLNKLGVATLGAQGAAAATWNTSFNADQEAFLKIDTRQAGSFHTLLLRAVNPGASNVTGYEVLAKTNTNQVRVDRWDSDLTGATLVTISQTLSDGDSIGATVVGTTGHVCYKVGAGAWTEIGTFDSSTYNNAGKIGIRLIAGGTLADDFGGGNH